MKKDRFVAFFDAIMAIIMTIAVLQFTQPAGTRWQDMDQLFFQILVYMLSFFWLGMMWITIHNLWHDADQISHGVIWVNLFTLFFSSMIPFLIVFVGLHFNDKAPQFLYGIDMICITLCNQLSVELLLKGNPQLADLVKAYRRACMMDICVKIPGIVIGMTVFPPAMMISVFIALIMLIINHYLMKKRTDKKD